MTDDQRIERAAAELCRIRQNGGWTVLPGRTREEYRQAAREILEAADRESPKWPTDESVHAFGVAENARFLRGPKGDPDYREPLRQALLADPIIRAAVELRDVRKARPDRAWERSEALQGVVDAVNEAGL